ncbi:MAG: glycosyltransferase [Sphaerochaetaceae bacterium]|nr:glycosyltransferase [Sphaerochaetaceae bacterium]
MKSDKEKLNQIEYNYLPVLNIPLVKNISDIVTSFFKALYLCKSKNDIIICDALNISISLGALFVAKLKKNKIVTIITDIPEMQKTINTSKFKIKCCNFVIKNSSSYIFLTEQMNDLKNMNHNPYVIIEGLVDVNMRKKENVLDEKYKNKVIMYTGGLYKKYGINNLVKGFIKANIYNSELHIYGNGDYVKELLGICNLNPSIKYYGIVPNEVVVEEQLKATLLVNPRATSEEYTKYSFPSKNMEYMASGTATLTTLLPGMPKEYLEFVYLLNNETVEGISEKLNLLLNLDLIELHKKGHMAKEFVLKTKNNRNQAKKLIDMARTILQMDNQC